MGFKRSATLVVLTAIIVKFVPTFFETKLPLHFGGNVEDGWHRVQRAFNENFYWGWEHEGAAFAVYYKGRLVVDLWGGYADQSAVRTWKEDTMSPVYSSTKAVATLCIAMLVDRGLLDNNSLVTKYWPEFGKNYKDNVTVAMLMNHQAGLVAFDRLVEKEDVWDHKRMSELIENQRPNWPAGTATGYHAISHGWLVDQLVRRVDKQKRSIGTFLNEEIAIPYNIDFYIGLPPELEYRVARCSGEGVVALLSTLVSDRRMLALVYGYIFHRSPLFDKLGANVPWLNQVFFRGGLNDPELHQMEIASATGIGTARGLAKILSLAVEHKIFGKETLQRFLQPIIREKDLVIGVPIRRSMGFMLSKRPQSNTETKNAWMVGHPGFGGQNAEFDAENEIAIAYVTNGLKPTMGDMTRSYTNLKRSVYDTLREMKK